MKVKKNAIVSVGTTILLEETARWRMPKLTVFSSVALPLQMELANGFPFLGVSS